MIRFAENVDFSWRLNYPCSTGKHNIPPRQTENELKHHDILVVDFLYQNYIKKFEGAILNEEDGFNTQLQVSAFLNILFCTVNKKNLVLILTSDEDITKWHYHIKNHGELNVQIVDTEKYLADFEHEHAGLVLLLPFKELKLADALMCYSFISVIIDHFDEVATKLIVKKLKGEFNVGISSRNFYRRPNQKLQWTMLNWSNPGIIGKLSDFYTDNSRNFFNLRDCYNFWWLSLTWEYDKLKRPSELEILDYTNKLSEWAAANGLLRAKKKRTQSGTVKNLRKCSKISHDDDELIGEMKYSDLIEYETDVMDKSHDRKDNSENLNPIPAVKEETSDIFKFHCISTQKDLHEEISDTEVLRENNILLSIINGNETEANIDHQSHLVDTKNELLSEIFDDFPSPENEPNTDDSDFLLSLI